MKFVVFWEFDPKNLETILKKGQDWVKEQKAHPEKYAKFMRLQDGTPIQFSMVGQSKGLSLREVDNEEQMYNAAVWWNPYVKLTYVPIRQSPGIKEM